MTEEKTRPPVAKEVAEEEFERFLEAMDLDFNEDEMDQEDKQEFTKNKGRFIKAVERGRLVVNEKGEPVYSPTDGSDPITFHEPTGAHFLSSDRKKKNHDVAKMYAVIAATVGDGEARVLALPERDQKVIRAIAILFLA